MISYVKLLKKMEEKGMNSFTIRKENIIGQETLRKLKAGTGICEKVVYKSQITTDKDGNQVSKHKITSIDTKTIETFCIKFNCQPSDIMQVIPNTWDRANDLLEALNYSREKAGKSLYTRSDLSDLLPMNPPEDPAMTN